MEPRSDRPTPRAPGDAPALARRTAAAGARRVLLGFGVREIGVGALAVSILVATSLWWRGHRGGREADLRQVQAVRAMQQDIADVYQEKFSVLRAEAMQARRWADAQPSEPDRTWARERARRLETLVRALDREASAAAYAAARREIEGLVADGRIAAAKERLAGMRPPEFPPPAEFGRLREAMYELPLAAFSRQNPEFYRMFRRFEAEAARMDEQKLRVEIENAGADSITPQLMLKVDLLAAVAAKDDPLVAEWSALTSALDYLENPDAEALARWHKAQAALRRNDAPTAAHEMQAILKSKVRTRQPFRAALGRALLRSRPDDPGMAYPYMAEAAAAGDRQARAWLAKEEFRLGRNEQARRWLESAVADGELASVPILVEVYERMPVFDLADATNRMGVLERVTDRPGAPAAADLLLGRLYERTDPQGSRARDAFACYERAASKGSAAGHAEVARCTLRGIGTQENLNAARDAACRAFAGGEREQAVPILLELLERTPDRTAQVAQALFGEEHVGAPAGYTEARVIDGPGVAQLKHQLARHLDRLGHFGKAAQLYRSSGDPAGAARYAQLTASNPCATCGESGKVQVSAACPTCGGKGTQVCSGCGGIGFTYLPGAPPCTTCGASGTVIQERRVVACSTCGGTGRGKGSVIKQDCAACERGAVRCPTCAEGTIRITKECPTCHGRGHWKLAE